MKKKILCGGDPKPQCDPVCGRTCSEGRHVCVLPVTGLQGLMAEEKAPKCCASLPMSMPNFPSHQAGHEPMGP